MKTTTFVLIFLVFGGFLIEVNYQFNLNEKEDQKGFLFAMGKWIHQLIKNTVSITGYAVKMQWLPEGTDAKDAVDYFVDKNSTNKTNDTNLTIPRIKVKNLVENVSLSDYVPKVIYVND